MRSMPNVVLLSRPDVFEAEDQVAMRIRDAGFPLRIIRAVDELGETVMSRQGVPTIVIACLLATTAGTAGAEGYRQFLLTYGRLRLEMDPNCPPMTEKDRFREYWSHSDNGPLRLMVITPPRGRHPEGAPIGIGNLVDCYVNDPKGLDCLIPFLDRLAQTYTGASEASGGVAAKPTRTR